MNRPFASLLIVTLAFCGCFHSKKTAKPKESPAIATEMEQDFMQRYVEKRTAELVAQGATPMDAHAQAIADFKARYGYTNAARKD